MEKKHVKESKRQYSSRAIFDFGLQANSRGWGELKIEYGKEPLNGRE